MGRWGRCSIYRHLQSYETGWLLEDWRIAYVVPIFKKGDRTNRENYRPVSLTCVPCKVMESIIKDALIKHLGSNQLLCIQQHGFRKGRSCLTNLLETMESCTQALDNVYGLDVVYLLPESFWQCTSSTIVGETQGIWNQGKTKSMARGLFNDCRSLRSILTAASHSKWSVSRQRHWTSALPFVR